ncbi:MAG: glycosyltransferase family 9 protein [Saprospiraceae bacterium]|nr:glycosyltransferase family 9 protein [Saprospiraceae bacterium]
MLNNKFKEEEIKKVLVIRLSSIGDIVVTSPVVRWLKLQKAWEIHFLTKQAFAGITAHNIYIDKHHFLESTSLLDELKAENFDLVIDLHKSMISRKLAFLLKKPVIGFDKLNIKKWFLVNFKINLLPEIHLVDRYLASMRSLGIDDDGLGLDYFIDPSASLDDFSLPENYNVLVLGAAHATKRIPVEVAQKIILKSPYPVTLIGGKDVLSEAALLSSSGQVLNLAGKLSLAQSALVMQGGEEIYSGDTGMMHIAAALKKNIHVFWGNTTPVFGMYPYYGFKNNVVSINHEVFISCRPCSKLGHKTCPQGHFRCMMDQTIEI